MAHLYIIVPILNEADNLTRLFGAFNELVQQFSNFKVVIIVVDDGSTDNTANKLQELRENLDLVVLTHKVNQGPGRAFGTAFEYLAERLEPTDWVITIEGDNTSRQELINTMMRRATEENYDVVFASPYMYGGGITNTTTLRVVLSKIANSFVKEILGIHGIITASSFFRLYRGSVILALQQHYGDAIIERKGFECMIELLIKLINLKKSISEVPMLLDTNLRAGKSKMKIGRTIRGYVSIYFRLKHWRDLAGVEDDSHTLI